MAAKFSERLEQALARRGVPARVILTDNRVRMLSARRVGDTLELRVAQHLAELGDEAFEAVVGWATGDRGAQRRVRVLLARAAPPPPLAMPLRPVRLETRGVHHDLAVIAAVERARYFPALRSVPVTWGARFLRRDGQRSIRLGSYDFRRGIVRVHRWLDDPAVPSWFIGFIVFHELLHAELGAEAGPGRRRGVHSAEFRRREGQHHRFAEALAWEGQHLHRLLNGTL